MRPQIFYTNTNNRFTTDLDRKAALEYFFSGLFKGSLSLIESSKMPPYYGFALKKAKEVKASQHAAEIDRMARFILEKLLTSRQIIKSGKVLQSAMAIAFTSAAETVNHRNCYTTGYWNEPFGLACENILADAKRRTDKETLELIRHDNFPQLGNIIRAYCDNETISIEAL